MAAIKISEFVHNALFDRLSGYYRKKNPIGKNSDFITAPEISQVFGELIAAYFLQIFSAKRSRISFIEMGAGTGTLFFDILNSFEKLAAKNNRLATDFLACTTFHIVEINPVLREIQQQKLKNFKVSWYEKFEDLALDGEIFFISNELFDCFPIDQFVKTDIGWCERLTDSTSFMMRGFDPEIHRFVQNLVEADAPLGAVFEHSMEAKKFMSQLCDAIKTQGGIAINFDYGYFKTEFANTLQAVKNHRKVEVFEKDADISAHVDFAALNKIARSFDLKSSLVTQGEFLLSLGIEERRKILPASQNSAIDRLIAPDQMGDLFKCHIVWKE